MSEMQQLKNRNFMPYSLGHRVMYNSTMAMLHETQASVLDIGCGIGYGFERYRVEKIKGEYLGIERDTDSSEYSKKLGATIINADWLDTNGIGIYDYLFCIEVIEHVEKIQEFLKKCRKHVCKNMFLSTPPETHRHGKYSIKEVYELLKEAGFSNIVHVYSQWTVLYVCNP